MGGVGGQRQLLGAESPHGEGVLGGRGAQGGSFLLAWQWEPPWSRRALSPRRCLPRARWCPGAAALGW